MSQENRDPHGNPTTDVSQEPATLTPDQPPVAEAADAEKKPRRPRGFAAMDPKLVKEIARKGGRAAHTAGTAHEFTSEEARVAGMKGGLATHAKRRRATTENAPVEPQGDTSNVSRH